MGRFAIATFGAPEGSPYRGPTSPPYQGMCGPTRLLAVPHRVPVDSQSATEARPSLVGVDTMNAIEPHALVVSVNNLNYNKLSRVMSDGDILFAFFAPHGDSFAMLSVKTRQHFQHFLAHSVVRYQRSACTGPRVGSAVSTRRSACCLAHTCCQLAASVDDRLAANSGGRVVWPDAGGVKDAIASTSCWMPASVAV
jgi:hypothetical protein